MQLDCARMTATRRMPYLSCSLPIAFFVLQNCYFGCTTAPFIHPPSHTSTRIFGYRRREALSAA